MPSLVGLRLRRPPSAMTLAVAVTLVAAALYLTLRPLSSDFTAQIARTDVVRRAGDVSWWTGWLGGLSLPNYSLLVPAWMAVVGVRLTGVLALIAGSVAGASLVRDTVRPRAGAVAVALSGTADLLAGRVTFVVGLAIAAWALAMLRSHRTGPVVVLAVAAYLASPLAGLFLGLVAVAVFAVDRTRRLPAAAGAGSLAAVAGVMAFLFPSTGVMPYKLTDMIWPAVGCAVVAATCPTRLVRVNAVLALIALPAFYLVPGAVGGNIARLAWVCAVPAVVACAHLPRRRLIAAVALVAVWPVSDLLHQVTWTSQPTAAAAFYRPVIAQVQRAQAQAGGSALGQRVEVLDTVNHWASVYIAQSLTIARGWDRQADAAQNPIFYRPEELTARSYQTWLHELAVGWVAVPNARLDYGSIGEAALVRSGPGYLKLTWSSPHWKLYRVLGSTPLASGAQVSAVDASSVTLRSAGPAQVRLRMRWNPYLSLVDPRTGTSLPACIENDDGYIAITVPAAETFRVVSGFSPTTRLHRTDTDCTRDLLHSA